MLTKAIKKRIFLIISSIFIIIIVYLFPTKKEDIKIKENMNNPKDETIIYLKDNNNYISRVSVYVKDNDINSRIKEIINYLTIKSSNSNYIKEGFKPIIPVNTKVLSISIDKTLVKLNFSKELLNVSEEDEEKMLSSIIYSITSIDGIDSISIYIDGNLLTKLPNSGKSLPSTLNRSFGINKSYNLTNVTGTTSTTIYYLAKQNDYYYYVPVTMINNNKNDKMEIIITELASKFAYQTGLISFLKSAKQMSYELDKDKIQVNIEKELFNNLNSSNILETVIYSMNLSIKDNYRVNKVTYLIDDNIYKSYDI